MHTISYLPEIKGKVPKIAIKPKQIIFLLHKLHKCYEEWSDWVWATYLPFIDIALDVRKLHQLLLWLRRLSSFQIFVAKNVHVVCCNTEDINLKIMRDDSSDSLRNISGKTDIQQNTIIFTVPCLHKLMSEPTLNVTNVQEILAVTY